LILLPLLAGSIFTDYKLLFIKKQVAVGEAKK